MDFKKSCKSIEIRQSQRTAVPKRWNFM